MRNFNKNEKKIVNFSSLISKTMTESILVAALNFAKLTTSITDAETDILHVRKSILFYDKVI